MVDIKQARGSMPAVALVLGWVLAGLLADGAGAQRPDPEPYGTYDGDTIYTVLQPDMIPAIDQPQLVSGEEAAEQMAPQEMVLGMVVGGEARAYSLWQLDAHEIVNDVAGGIPIAATW